MSAAGERARITLDLEAGVVSDCDAAASNLLNGGGSSLEGRAIAEVLPESYFPLAMLAQAVSLSLPVTLPPFLCAREESGDIVLGGLLLPEGRGQLARLLVWPHLETGELESGQSFGAGDTIAVLGVDGAEAGKHDSIADYAGLMSGICTSLRQIVRRSDTLSSSSVSAVYIVIRDQSLDEARDICRALLSHLHRDTSLCLEKAGLRIGFGLAARFGGESMLATLWRANSALLLARGEGTLESTRVSVAGDYGRLLGRALGDAGVFAGAPVAAAASTAPAIEETGPVSMPPGPVAPVAPIERDIDGYVVDNMEGAVDQAIFLAGLDTPVAIIGAAGTGKMYVARIIHEASGGAPDTLVSLDCGSFRSRSAARSRIAQELRNGEGRTLVFKSPHLLHPEMQQKLARQISSRRLSDTSPVMALPAMKLVALFPEPLEVLLRRGELISPLASVFAGYPIQVPPIRDRKQAVLRWAHKILGQEGEQRDRNMRGFTPDAEQAMLQYDWPGNISEMRQCIQDALDKTDKNWLTPVDLGLFKGFSADGAADTPAPSPFLAAPQQEEKAQDAYVPSTREAVDVALGQALHNLLALGLVRPLGLWLEDELVLAAVDRCRGDTRRAAQYLHTRPRNIGRWMPKIVAREDERSESSLWQEPRRLLQAWVRESPQPEESPLLAMAERLLVHIEEQGAGLSTANRARIVGVSTPTYLKRMREWRERQ